MAKVCVLLADGFEEIEAVTIIDVLRRAGLEVVTLGVGTRNPRGSHGIRVEADATLDEAGDKEWDLVVLPGGMPGATRLRDDPRVQALVKRQAERGGLLGAICAAPIALGKAGVLEGKRATCYPGFEGELRGATCLEDRVVADGNIVTSRGPGTALDFALALVERLRGKEVAEDLRHRMLAAA